MNEPQCNHQTLTATIQGDLLCSECGATKREGEPWVKAQRCEQCEIKGVNVRPYGPNRSDICYQCAHFRSPDLTAIARMYELMDTQAREKARLDKLRADFPDATVISVSKKELRDLLMDPSVYSLINAVFPNLLDALKCGCSVCSPELYK